MNVFITSLTFDLTGHAEINTLADDTDGETTRRVSRVATLDGGVVITDRGHAAGDKTLEYRWRTVSHAHNADVENLVKNYARLHVATRTGFYLVAPKSFLPGVAESQITLLVIERLG